MKLKRKYYPWNLRRKYYPRNLRGMGNVYLCICLVIDSAVHNYRIVFQCYCTQHFLYPWHIFCTPGAFSWFILIILVFNHLCVKAQLVTVYSIAAQLTGEDCYRSTVEDILTYVARDLTHPLGGCFSAEVWVVVNYNT